MIDHALSYLGAQELKILLALAVLFVVVIFILPLIGVNFGATSRAFRASGMGTFFASRSEYTNISGYVPYRYRALPDARSRL